LYTGLPFRGAFLFPADIFRSIQTEDIQMAEVRFELTTFGPSLQRRPTREMTVRLVAHNPAPILGKQEGRTPAPGP
jgi:hypothetical protein